MRPLEVSGPSAMAVRLPHSRLVASQRSTGLSVEGGWEREEKRQAESLPTNDPACHSLDNAGATGRAEDQVATYVFGGSGKGENNPLTTMLPGNRARAHSHKSNNTQ